MMETFEKDGLWFKITNGAASVELTTKSAYNVTIPSEIDGIPVREVFCYFYSLGVKNTKYIRIPESVSKLSFGHIIPHAVRIEIDERNPCYFSDGKAVYSKDCSELIYFLARDDEEYVIRTGCKKISAFAFSVAINLKRVIFPSGLNDICSNAFYKCEGLEELELPDGLIKIEPFAFYECTGLKKITFPSTLEYLDKGAFKESSDNLTVHLPKMLKLIDEEALPKSWTLKLSEENKNFISRSGLILSPDGKKVLYSAEPFGSNIITVPDNAVEIAPSVFFGYYMMEKVILPKTLQIIGESAFSYAREMKEINLENVKKIGSNAFRGCIALEKIDLNCDMLGECVFIGCTNLTQANINCEKTGKAMFSYCESLQRVVLTNTKLIGAKTFFNTRALKHIVLPPELETIEDEAFWGSGISSLTIPKSVRHIGRNIANKIREIHIYDNIETDIRFDNDISEKDYILYVHSAESDKIKYAVPVLESHDKIVGMFRNGVTFDFEEFDTYFDSLFYYETDKMFEAGIIRLKYGYELDESTRRQYKDRLRGLAPNIAKEYIEMNRVEKLFEPEIYEYLNEKELLSLIDLSAQNGMTELTAFLMQIYNEKS